ncbi:transglutaminase family protein [Ketogulonicigenium vulgare]|uniref:transglutaminase family protein n=1 Tax=Ketogulonicigenium vulgare TaxID=92945 RepID=UPI00235A23BC|nr:transglutaminase family protein [Ketogulonicigenium vulgare]
MIYDIRLSMRYHYGSPAMGGRHVLRLLPYNIAGVQQVERAQLVIEPAPHTRSDSVDFYGNVTTSLVLTNAHDAIDFTLTARVQRTRPEDLFDTTPSLAGIAAQVAGWRDLSRASPHHYLMPSPRVIRDADVAAWARDVVAGAPTVFDAANRLNCALHDLMRYDPDATTVETPLSEAFAARHGVCQDFSHIMIAALRDLGVPAGYVSGLLRTSPPPGQPRLEGADAMHAWVAVWCGRELGWVQFDPTNAVRAGTDHILIATGRDYSDVAPVKGVLRSSGAQTAAQAVDVVPLD